MFGKFTLHLSRRFGNSIIPTLHLKLHAASTGVNFTEFIKKCLHSSSGTMTASDSDIKSQPETTVTATEATDSASQDQEEVSPCKTTQVDYNGVTYTSLKEGAGEVLFASSNGVFYNPVQEFNRDVSIAILRQFSSIYKKKTKDCAKEERRQAYLRRLKATTTQQSDPNAGQEESGAASATRESPAEGTQTPKIGERDEGGLRILEALAASGLRSIRYAKEIPGVKEIVTNDLSKQAVECIQRNVEYSGLSHLITPSLGDASLLLYKNRGGVSTCGERFDVVDLDPYGSPHLFLDGAVQAVAEGGLLLVTCTDMAVLCGNSPDTCHAKYGATSVKTKACHEIALRIALQCIESHANRYGRYIEPLVSISADFYIRMAMRVYTGQSKVKESYTKVGSLHHCVGCQTTTTQPAGIIEVSGSSVRHKLPNSPPVGEKCVHCNSRHQIAGPIWLAPIHSREFVDPLVQQLEGNWPDLPPTLPKLGTHRRMLGMLSVISEELPDVPLYYVADKLFSVIRGQSCKLHTFLSALLNAGYRTSQSHCHKNSIKTDAPASVVWDVVRAIEKIDPSIRMRKEVGAPGNVILMKEPAIKVNFSPHPDANPASRQKTLRRFQINPERFWGPQTRSSTTVLDQSQQNKKIRNQGRHISKREIKQAKFIASKKAERIAKEQELCGDDKARTDETDISMRGIIETEVSKAIRTAEDCNDNGQSMETDSDNSQKRPKYDFTDK